MANSFILDTHALLWYLEGNKRLGGQARKSIAAPDSHLIIPIIALAEASVIIDQRRTKVPSIAHLLESLARDPRFDIYPLTLDIFKRSLLSDLGRVPELHDRLIAATGLFLHDNGYEIGLITTDQSLTEARLLPVIW
jgi:PIN domain nuclease of toxin-antitoxin system